MPLPTCLLLLGALAAPVGAGDRPPSVSGIHPRLAVFNDENECGIGAVVPWAGRLWFLTYAPHRPRGSGDRLYSLGPELDLVDHPESVGGTPAGRLIHRETRQLVLGPYVIDDAGRVRVVPPDRMPGRLTAVARHLGDPGRKVLVATMEEGLYELNLETLEVGELYADDQGQLRGEGSNRPVADLPGYHGKGMYSGQGRVVYANNGEPGPEALRRPDIPSGCLAEWDGERWSVVRRAQFTDVTGPGGLLGNTDEEAPLWSIGWDHRSLLLMLLDGGEWHAYRLPRASHAYDGAHGWNTEWPRIRDIGETDLLMTMHGAFWRFPRTFSAARSAGIEQRSTYLKVVADFARFGEHLVLGCDDVARSGFLNRDDGLAPPGQSHSNLWFLDPADLDRLGPALGRGAVWLDEEVRAGEVSDPFLFSGFDLRGVHLAHGAEEARTFVLEVDRAGSGAWEELLRAEVPARGHRWLSFAREEPGAWIRARLDRPTPAVTVHFSFRDEERRGTEPAPRFDGLLPRGSADGVGGWLRVRGEDLRTLAVAPVVPGDGPPLPLHELDGDLVLSDTEDPAALSWTVERVAVRRPLLSEDAASLVLVDPEGRTWRLPRSPRERDAAPTLGLARERREVVTERNLLHAGGTFYELPAENAGGIARLRPIASHPFEIQDYAGYRGLLVMTGLRGDAEAGPRVIRADEGPAAVWVGAIDDLWQLGRPVGVGGPWLETPVEADSPSDPYLLTGFARRELRASHDGPAPVTITLEIDATGVGPWWVWKHLVVPPGESVTLRFPDAFEACWLRVSSDTTCRATVQLDYR